MIRFGTKKDITLLIPIRFEVQEDYNKLAGKKIKITEEGVKKEFKHALSKKGILLVAEENGELVGFLTATIVDNITRFIGYIDDLAVTKKYRNKGYATQLMNKFEAEMKKKGVKTLKLGVKTNNEEAIRLYKKQGFKIEHYEMEKIIE